MGNEREFYTLRVYGAFLLLTLVGLAGVHRLYLGRPVTAILYLVTWGWFGVGTLYDVFNARRNVTSANATFYRRIDSLLGCD
ncbi:TM2 domain-containing protein [Vibrio owensii]|uniref:TM2 domain-containing protein n=1 Tax=Vibrio owensii TaxID=696485 RepID=UPI0018F16C84